MCVFCAQMLRYALHDHYYNLCWEGAMQRSTMLFYRPGWFEYSVSSLTAPTPWSCPHEYAEACAFDSCFPSVTSEDHVTICWYTAKSCSWFAYHTFGCFLLYFPNSCRLHLSLHIHPSMLYFMDWSTLPKPAVAINLIQPHMHLYHASLWHPFQLKSVSSNHSSYLATTFIDFSYHGLCPDCLILRPFQQAQSLYVYKQYKAFRG